MALVWLFNPCVSMPSSFEIITHVMICSQIASPQYPGLSEFSILTSPAPLEVVVEAYAYMHKFNPNIFLHFLSFYLCITILSLFAHHSNLFLKFFLFFFPFYSLQKPVTLTQHSCLLLFKCPD